MMHTDFKNKEDLMRTVALKITLCAASTLALTAAVHAAPDSPGPGATAAIMPIVAPRDRAYAGEIQLAVDAGDTGRRIVRVHETLTGIGPDTVLLYPEVAARHPRPGRDH